MVAGNAPVALADDGPSAVEFNMYGMKGKHHVYNQDVLSFTLARLILVNGSGTNPILWSAGFEEICAPQWYFLYNQFFGSRDFQITTYWANPNASSACQMFGNVVASRGASKHWELARPFQVQGASAPNELKGFACLRTNYYGQVACALHTQANNTSVANAQLNDLATAIDPFVVTAVPTLVLGDFNAEPWQSTQVSQWFYPLFTEADRDMAQMNSKRSTTDIGRRYDYVFRRAPNSRRVPATITTTSTSDHHFYTMHL